MTVERLNLEAYWRPRKASINECALHVAKCLHRIATCDEAFSQTWLECGNSLNEAITNKVDPTLESLQTLLAKGRSRRDSDKSIIEELGFSLGRLWNGWNKEAAVHISFTCGAYPDPKVLPFANNCLIELPYGGPVAERILQVDKLRCVMAAVVASWDPDVAAVSSYQMRAAVYPQTHRGPWVGWLTYLSDRHSSLPKLPDDYEVTRIEGLGSLIVIKGIDRITASNPAHVAVVRKLSNLLNAAGLLGPIPPNITT
jgi:hypothetical protein